MNLQLKNNEQISQRGQVRQSVITKLIAKLKIFINMPELKAKERSKQESNQHKEQIKQTTQQKRSSVNQYVKCLKELFLNNQANKDKGKKAEPPLQIAASRIPLRKILLHHQMLSQDLSLKEIWAKKLWFLIQMKRWFIHLLSLLRILILFCLWKQKEVSATFSYQ